MSIDYNALAIPKGKTVKQTRARNKRSDVKGLKAFRDGCWRRDRFAGLFEDTAACFDCRQTVFRESSPRGHVHHIISRRHLATRYEVSNGVIVCRQCHNKRHAREF